MAGGVGAVALVRETPAMLSASRRLNVCGAWHSSTHLSGQRKMRMAAALFMIMLKPAMPSRCEGTAAAAAAAAAAAQP